MKLWPFGKNSRNDEGDEPQNELAQTEDCELEVTTDDSLLDIELYEHKSFDSKTVKATSYIDAVIPAVGAVADAAAQYGHAIVRFPEGANWADLINRKTPGWEGFKQLGILKDGKFQPQAAIKQAKLQPAAVGNLALQGAAMVVGQMYMVEINKQLDAITTGISAIQEEMRLDRESNIEACMEMLKEYSEDYMAISDDPVELQAVRTQIEAIRKEAKSAWNFQIKQLQSMEKSLQKSGKLKEEDLKVRMKEFAQRDRSAHDSFIFLMAAEQVKMQYSQSYSETQIAKERESIQNRISEYSTLRDGVQKLLFNKISKVGGKPLAIPSVDKTRGKAGNPFEWIGQQAPRIFIPNMRTEAKRLNEEKKDNYESFVKREDPIGETADARLTNLNDIDFIYNQANILLIDENGIHYLKEDDDPEDNSDE